MKDVAPTLGPQTRFPSVLCIPFVAIPAALRPVVFCPLSDAERRPQRERFLCNPPINSHFSSSSSPSLLVSTAVYPLLLCDTLGLISQPHIVTEVLAWGESFTPLPGTFRVSVSDANYVLGMTATISKKVFSWLVSSESSTEEITLENDTYKGLHPAHLTSWSETMTVLNRAKIVWSYVTTVWPCMHFMGPEKQEEPIWIERIEMIEE